MLRLVNVTEHLLFDMLDDILKGIKGFCGCKRCRMDVAAIALNNLPTNYVVTDEGEVKKRAAILEMQKRIDITQAVIKAAEIVSMRPHHSRED